MSDYDADCQCEDDDPPICWEAEEGNLWHMIVDYRASSLRIGENRTLNRIEKQIQKLIEAVRYDERRAK